jgi:outer membrane protein OmpA-like peptidoglycan-associated protein
VLVIALAAQPGGCTAMPDWANPVAWLRDEAPPPARLRIDDSGTVEEFPNLASVPETPPTVTPPRKRERMIAGLEADRSLADITGQPSRRAAGEQAPRAPDRAEPDQVEQSARLPPVPAGLEYVAVIYFEVGSATLGERDRRVLGEVAALYRERGKARVRVVGHASGGAGDEAPAEPDLDNLEISLRRAGAVAAALSALGIDAEHVEAVGMSDNQPVYYEVTPTGEAGNRRVEVFFEK